MTIFELLRWEPQLRSVPTSEIVVGAGSDFKIDASYLSSHVNMAMRLEGLTAEYDVSMLLTEPVVRLCSMSFACHLRILDNVKLHGSKAAVRLFTVDRRVTNAREREASNKSPGSSFGGSGSGPRKTTENDIRLAF